MDVRRVLEIAGRFAAVITGKPVGLGGSLGRDAATGRGALFALDRIAQSRRWTREHIRVAVEGFGNAGAWFAQLAHQMGYRVVAVSDSRGAVVNPEGLIPHDVLEHKQETGSVTGFKHADSIDGDDLIGVECEVLAPAALERSIRGDNAERVRATLVLELANHPTTPDGDLLLQDRGVWVVPDILGSAGGVTVSYLEWVQNLQRERWTRGARQRTAQGADGVGHRPRAGARRRGRGSRTGRRPTRSRSSGWPRRAGPAAGTSCDFSPSCPSASRPR